VTRPAINAGDCRALGAWLHPNCQAASLRMYSQE